MKPFILCTLLFLLLASISNAVPPSAGRYSGLVMVRYNNPHYGINKSGTYSLSLRINSQGKVIGGYRLSSAPNVFPPLPGNAPTDVDVFLSAMFSTFFSGFDLSDVLGSSFDGLGKPTGVSNTTVSSLNRESTTTRIAWEETWLFQETATELAQQPTITVKLTTRLWRMSN